MDELSYGGVKVTVHRGVEVKPKWFDFPRRLGWRKPKVTQLVNDGEIIRCGDRWIVNERTFRQLKEAIQGPEG